MQVPEAVIREAQPLIDMFGSHFEHLGDYEGQGAWLFIYPDNAEIGFPSVFLCKNNDAIEIGGFMAVDIIRSFRSE